MAFCTNCGHEIREGARFCDGCGAPVVSNQAANTRKQVYEGSIHKCPSCGQVLNSFTAVCPSCGYEIRGAKATESIRDFSIRLEKAKSADEKATIIRHYPIPNTYEDIQEFLILASSNIDEMIGEELSAAWATKLDQVVQKARLIVADSNELSRIESHYQQIRKRLEKERTIKKAKRIGTAISEIVPVLPQTIIVFGWLISIFVLLPLCRTNLDNVGTNSFQLLLILDFLAGAILIPFALRNGVVLPKLIASAGIILSIVFMIPLCKENLDNVGTNAFQLLLIIEIICCIVIIIRTIRHDKKTNTSLCAPNGISLIVTLICLLVFWAVYGIGTLKISKGNSLSSSTVSPTITEEAQTDEDEGIYSYEIRNYVGKNLASIGKVSGNYLIDEYGSADVKIVIVTESGMIVPGTDTELKKQYTVVAQNITAGSEITVVHLRDSKGRPFSSLVDYQSQDEIVLYVVPVGENSYSPIITTILPTLDRHTYHIRDYVGRNAASFGKYSGQNRVDEYGKADLKIVFSSEDGSFVDSTDINVLKNYIVIEQDIKPNTELKLVYETNSRGEEFDSLIRSQNYEEINLTVRLLDESVILSMPELVDNSGADEEKEYVELTIKYKVIGDGKAEISGFVGNGNHATIDKKIDGYDIIRIGDNAFKDCTTLESVLFWADIESIGDYAFAGCTSLTSISVPNETTYIGKHAFDGCTSLSSLILWGHPEIDDYAFYNCESITSVSISVGTERIGAHAFDGCTGLTSVIIWDDNTIIDKEAFANCPNLENRPIQE